MAIRWFSLSTIVVFLLLFTGCSSKTFNFHFTGDGRELLIHSITVFDREEDAVMFFEEVYKSQRELLIESAKLKGSSQENFTPPRKYNYQSPIAHKFKVLYDEETDLTGKAVGYEYAAYARYGNVVSWFVPTVEDEEQTNIKAGEANVLPWSEVERLLKLIDKKFQQASSTTK